MKNKILKSAGNEVVQLNSDSTAISHITNHIFDVAETSIGSIYLLDDGRMTDFKYVNICGVPLTKEDFNMAIEAIVYLYDPYDAYYAHEGEKYANISYENLLKEYNMTKINLKSASNKVAQQDWKNKIDVNSFDAEFVAKMASCGYKPEDVIAIEDTDIGPMYLLNDGLMTDFNCKFIRETPLTDKDFHRAINLSLLLDCFCGLQYTTYEQLEKELNKLM